MNQRYAGIGHPTHSFAREAVSAVPILWRDERPDVERESMHRVLCGREPGTARLPLMQLTENAQVDAILDSLRHVRRDSVLAILRHPVDSVARVMRTDFEVVDGGTSVADALQRLRASTALSNDVVSLLFVTDAEGHYLGHVRLSSLMRAEPGTVVGSIVESRNNRIAPTDNKVDAARLQRTNLPVLPVVDTANRLVGVIRFDDAMDVLEEDTSEDVYKKAGIGDLIHNKDVVRSEKLTSGGIGYPVKVRLAFLMVTLAGGLMVGGVIDFFEDTLAAIVALAIFIPLVMDISATLPSVGTRKGTGRHPAARKLMQPTFSPARPRCYHRPGSAHRDLSPACRRRWTGRPQSSVP